GPVVNGRGGRGHVVDLPAYENDVLHALALTGGLPGLDAYDAVLIARQCFRGETDRAALVRHLEGQPPGGPAVAAYGTGQVLRIPLRQPAGAPPCFRPDDVLLQTGDVVFLEA